ncbi:MAG TPA: hypothetical protein DCQ04_13945, partial [Actinobacteria bacterium]|nr:hypothetical protein [Actinomycetota bacterium]
LFAAAIAATSVATISTVSADIGDPIYTEGYMRIMPAPAPNGTWEDQPAPVLQAGDSDKPAASVQLLIPTNWESGDKITLQVQADNPAGVPAHTTNCLSPAQSVSFAGPYDASSVIAASVPFVDGLGWQFLGDVGDTLANAPTNGAGTNPDPMAPDLTPSVKPTFTVALKTSPSCVGVGVTDQIELIFSNTATVIDGGQYEISFTNIRYNIGAGVNPGPLHVIPFAQQARDGAPGTYDSVGVFGNGADRNIYGPVTLSPFWTNNAYVAAVSLSTTGTNIVADNNYQSLGSITLTELWPDALGDGTHFICLPIIDQLLNPMTVAFTGGNVGASATAVINAAAPPFSNNCIILTLNGMNNAALGTVTISNLVGETNTSGTIVAALIPGTAPNWTTYLNPDDQAEGLSGVYSDVNVGTYPVKPFAVALTVPTRIGGNDRFETAAKIGANVSQCADTVVVVSGASYPDALSANYLAGTLDAFGGSPFGAGVPVLLVGTDAIPPAIAAYMAAAGAKNVYIVGGTSAVSAAVEAALKDTPATKCFFDSIGGPTAPQTNAKLLVRRVSGADRYATNRAVINLAADIYPALRNNLQLELLQPGKRTAIVATGSSFADALAAGPASYNGLPLILTDGTTLSAAAIGALADNDIKQVIIIGGTAAVSDAVKTSIEALGITTGRVSGADRYATATAWADFMAKGCVSTALAYDCGLGYGVSDRVLLASGTSFADALAGGPLGAQVGPIVLTDPTTLSAATQTWMVANRLLIN